MNLIAFGMNLLLAVLLAGALTMGWRLNRRLKALRDSHDGFAKAVRDLNAAAARAEQGLADLRTATDEATDTLADRIEKGRALVLKLERLSELKTERDENIIADGRLGALLSAAREVRGERPERQERPAPVRRDRPARLEIEEPMELAEPVGRRRARLPEDDIFADIPPRHPLSAIAGGRR